MPNAIECGEFLALLYADIFDYPLTRNEMHTWSINNIVGAHHDAPAIISDGFYFCLPGREKILSLRSDREQISLRKKSFAQKWTKFLKIIPTLRAVFLTGNVAVGNSDENDDIDLLLITSPKTIWITRLLVIFLTTLMGVRRKVGDREFKNKICLNLFMDKDHLMVEKEKQGLYTAHEVLYAIPLWDRGGIYLNFLITNEWVSAYLPNAWKTKPGVIASVCRGEPCARPQQPRLKNPLHNFQFSISYLLFTIYHLPFRLFEPLARLIQLKHMESHLTTETISNTLLAFHPSDNRLKFEELFYEKINNQK